MGSLSNMLPRVADESGANTWSALEKPLEQMGTAANDFVKLIQDYWWIVALIVIAVAVIWWFAASKKDGPKGLIFRLIIATAALSIATGLTYMILSWVDMQGTMHNPSVVMIIPQIFF